MNDDLVNAEQWCEARYRQLRHRRICATMTWGAYSEQATHWGRMEDIAYSHWWDARSKLGLRMDHTAASFVLHI